jgi:hypothetical protein
MGAKNRWKTRSGGGIAATCFAIEEARDFATFYDDVDSFREEKVVLLLRQYKMIYGRFASYNIFSRCREKRVNV